MQRRAGRPVPAWDWPLRSVTRNESLAQSVLEATAKGARAASAHSLPRRPELTGLLMSLIASGQLDGAGALLTERDQNASDVDDVELTTLSIGGNDLKPLFETCPFVEMEVWDHARPPPCSELCPPSLRRGRQLVLR